MRMEEFESVYRKHAAPVLGYARRCLGRSDLAEEIASEAFLELLKNLDKIDAGQLPAWLFTVARNRAMDYWRRHKLEAEYAAREDPAPARSQGNLDLTVFEGVPLNATHKLCLKLRYLHGMSREEIASFTGLRETQVKGYLRYGLELLRKALGERRGERT